MIRRSIAYLFTTLSIISIMTGAAAQDCQNFETYLRPAGLVETAYVNDVHIAGDIAFYLSEGALKVLGIGDPDAPLPLAEHACGNGAWNLHLNGDRAYIGGVSGQIEIVDVSDPAAPFQAGAFTVEEYPNLDSIAVDEDADLLYCFGGKDLTGVGWAGYIHVYDIADVAAPQLLYGSGPIYFAQQGSLICRDGLLYWARTLVSDEETCAVSILRFDTQMNELLDLSGDHLPGTCVAFDIHGSLLYLCNNRGSGRRILVYDISTPENMTLLSETPMETYCVDMTVHGDYLYAIGWQRELRIYDLFDPLAPDDLGGLSMPATIRTLAVENGLVAAAGPDILQLVELNAHVQAPDLDALEIPSAYPSAMVRLGDLLYVSSGGWGVSAVDISDPADLLYLGTANVGHANSYLVGAGNHIFASSWTDDVHVLRVDGPVDLVEVAVIDATSPRRMLLAGELLVVAQGEAGDTVQFHDVSDPAQPILLSEISLGGYWIQDLALAGDLLYVTLGQYGWQVLDIADPAAPQVLVHFIVSDDLSLRRIAIADDLAYVASWGGEEGLSSLRIWDVTDPLAPVALGSIPIATGTQDPAYWDLRVDGGVAYVASGVLNIVDVSDPAAPVNWGRRGAEGNISFLSLAEGTLFYLDAEITNGRPEFLHSILPQCSDLTAIVYATPGARIVLGAHPNPFNPTTSIVFELPARAEATLVVFDIGGRRVRNLAPGILAAGPHAVIWDGRDDDGRRLASGVYFCRLTAAGEAVAEKLLLLK